MFRFLLVACTLLAALQALNMGLFHVGMHELTAATGLMRPVPRPGQARTQELDRLFYLMRQAYKQRSVGQQAVGWSGCETSVVVACGPVHSLFVWMLTTVRIGDVSRLMTHDS